MGAWFVATTRTLARLEAGSGSDKTGPDGMTPHQQLMHNLKTIRAHGNEADLRQSEILERIRALEQRLDNEEKYRWKEQDRIAEQTIKALDETTTATRSLLGWLARWKGASE